MSKRGGRRRRHTAVAAAVPAKSEPSSVSHAPLSVNPLRARKKLFVALCGVFAIWVALLLTMYFVTVYPQRHHATSPLNTSAPE